MNQTIIDRVKQIKENRKAVGIRQMWVSQNTFNTLGECKKLFTFTASNPEIIQLALEDFLEAHKNEAL